MFARSSALFAIATVLIAVPVSAQQQAQPATSVATPQTTQGMARASSFIGQQIVDAQGKPVAVVRDFVVDAQGGLTAVVERLGTSGFTGVPLSRLSPHVVPTPAGAGASPTTTGTVTANPNATVDRFMFMGSSAQLQQAPPLQDVAQADDAWLAQVRQTFGLPISTVPASTTGQVARKPVALQSLLQRRVASAGGEQLGTVRDLAISLGDDRASFVVFDGTAAADGTPMFHGVALESFQFQDQRDLVLDTDVASLSQSKGLDLERLPAQASFTLPGPGPKTVRSSDKPAKPTEGGTLPTQPSSPSGPR